MTFAPRRPWFRAGRCTVVLLGGIAIAIGCGQTVEVGVDDPFTSGGSRAGNTIGGGTLELGGALMGGSASGESTSAGAAGNGPCTPTLCRGKSYACGNCLDDDGDGLIDAFDPDCLGPCDNDEVGLTTGLATSQSAACKQDCYFDGDAGPGNDKCQWSHQCDPLSVAPDYPPSGEARCSYNKPPMGVDCAALAANQDPACLQNCLPLVPNGCDCFGCCELPGGSGDFRFVGARGPQPCSLSTLADKLSCPPCTPVKDACFNDCTECEVCVGHVPAASCEPGGACKSGQSRCNAAAPCDTGEYCVTGCCVRAPVPT